MRSQRMSAKDRKRAIVRAALPLFTNKGFAATTTRELAHAAEVSEPLLYRHFPSKEALYEAIQNFCCQGNDPVVERLSRLTPSTATLVQLVYYQMRSLVLHKLVSEVKVDTPFRLMLNSLLEDGAFARLLYRNRVASFSARMESCLEAAIAAGDAVDSPASIENRVRFAHHVAAWLAIMHLPKKTAIDYRTAREDLLNQALWFALRGMGLTDKAIRTHYDPAKLKRAFKKEWR